MVSDLELNPLFRDIDKKYIDFLYPLFVRITCTKGTVVIQQGDAADFLYLIEKGAVEISYKPYDGETMTITHVGTNGLFGWSALVGSTKYTSSGIAIEDVDALRIRGADLRKLCVENPEAGKEILDRLASAVSTRWKDAHEQVRSILENGVKS
ncbi:MAG TPA: cyclic nucleotide-binding domain-containing protein [Anaerolineales bacterium]|nr:cyclic nucleotide-binding domain-containing protein [Anaerolineales bacterium]